MRLPNEMGLIHFYALHPLPIRLNLVWITANTPNGAPLLEAGNSSGAQSGRCQLDGIILIHKIDIMKLVVNFESVCIQNDDDNGDAEDVVVVYPIDCIFSAQYGRNFGFAIVICRGRRRNRDRIEINKLDGIYSSLAQHTSTNTIYRSFSFSLSPAIFTVECDSKL